MANFLDTPDTTSYYSAKDINSNKVMALLSYIGILWLIPLLVAKDSKFAKFHANQGILLTITAVAVGLVGCILGLIPYVGTVLGYLLGIVIFLMMIIGILNAVNGKAKELPFIGGFNILK